MKVAILGNFGGRAPSYALAVGWYERAKMLEYFGVDFTMFNLKTCPVEVYPNNMPIIPNVPSSKPFDYRVKLFEDIYLEHLQDFDVILTADMIYQKRGNFLAYNQAMRNASKKLKAWWCHWIHSSWTKRPSTLHYPENLKYTMMDRSFLVYLNSRELGNLKQMYQTTDDYLRCVYNPKDPRIFFNFHEFSWKIIERLQLYNKDVVCTFPHCSTRMEAKGFDVVAKTIAALKRQGVTVGLIFCNANARKVQIEIEQKREMLKSLDLIEWEDYVFTHTLNKFRPMPREVVRDLMMISNIFIFGSWRETTGNVFQEAQISDNLLVLNNNIPCLRELARMDDRVIFINTSYKTPGVVDYHTGDFKRVDYIPDENSYYNEVAKKYLLPNIRTKRHMWSFSFEKIWRSQFFPLLSEATTLANTVPIGETDTDKYLLKPDEKLPYVYNPGMQGYLQFIERKLKVKNNVENKGGEENEKE